MPTCSPTAEATPLLAISPRIFLVVDLGALEPSRTVDADRLPLGERVEGDMAGLAAASPPIAV
jgi:hypothetical protein